MNRYETIEYPPFTDITEMHKQTFSLLDEKTLDVTIIIYGAKIEKDGVNPEHNGIAIFTEHGDLIADDLCKESISSDQPSDEQFALFNKLKGYKKFPDFADAVNTLGREAGRLRMEL